MRRPSPVESRAVVFTILCALAACQDQCFEPPPETVLTVDYVSPTDGKVLTYVDDVAPSTVGFQHDVVVKAADSEGRAVTLESATLQTRLPAETTFTPGPAAQLAGDTATFPAVDLRLGINVLQVTVTESGSGRQASKTINVDAQFGRPAVLTFRFQGDANSDGALNQAEQSAGDPVALVTVQGVEDGQPVTIKDRGPAGTVYGTGTVSAGAATVTLTGLGVTDTTEGSYQLVASVVDRAGRDNVITNATPSQPLNMAAFKGLVVDRVPPVLTLLSPNVPGAGQILNMADDADAAATGFQVRVAIQTSADVGTNGVQIAHTPPGTTDTLTPDAVSHQASVDFTVPDAGPYDYTVTISIVDPSGNTRSRTFTLQIGGGGSLGFFSGVVFSDNSGPFKVNVSRTVPVSGSQSIVAATNLFYWNANTVAEIPNNVIVDQNLPTADAQVVIDATVAGGSGCTPKLLYNGSTVATGPAIGTNSPGTVTLSATLATGTSGPLRYVADCGGGRVFGLPPANLTVDVVAPSPLPATLALVNTGSFSERRPAVDVTWSAGNDDSTGAGQGAASGYEVRWGTNATLKPVISPVPADLYDRRPGIDTEARYFDANRAQLPAGGSLLSGATSFRLTGLPPIEDYYVQVRAKDDVGNLSPLLPTDCATRAACLPHQLRVTTLNNPGTAGFIGYVMEAADLNGDNATDLAFTSIGTRTAWVAYGGTTPFSTVSQVAIPVSAIGASVPYGIAVGNVGDLAAGGSRADLAVADPAFDAARGRYFIYFGRTGTIDPTPVELRGTAQGMSSGLGSGTSTDNGYIRIIPDFGSPGGGAPDGRDELAISANNDLSGLGRVYLFYGRPHDPGAAAGSWQALATAADSDAIPYIPLSAADRIFGGESPPSCQRCSAAPPAPTSAFFGVRLGYAFLGDITGDGIPDFTIPDSRDFVNRLYVFSGGVVNAAGAGTGVVIAPTTRVQRIDESEPPAPAVPDGRWHGFGAYALGGADIIGGLGRDLAVAYPKLSTVQLYRDGSASGFDTTAANVLKIVGGTTNFGRSMAMADLDQDGEQDLVIGTNACISLCSDGFAGGAWVFYNRRPSTPEYDLSTDNASFRTTRLMKDVAVTGNSDGLGLGVATGDFNGDGVPDVAVSDPVITSAPGRGKVYVRY